MSSLSLSALQLPEHLVETSHARVGLLGNPSDGYAGKTLSSTIDNFCATVEMEAFERVEFVPHPVGDCLEFGDLRDLSVFLRRNGYDGGIRLLMATSKTFWDALKEEKIELSPTVASRGFKMKYSTAVPRQLGLAGSSAICTAVFRALMRWYGVPFSAIPPERLAGYVLRAEQKELGIAAGLQDRVAQAYDCPVFMDFTPPAFAAHNGKHGSYTALPPMSAGFFTDRLFLLFPLAKQDGDDDDNKKDEAKSSGKVHSPVRKKWEEGDVFTRTMMEKIAALAEKGRDAIARKDDLEFVRLMNENFALRVQLFGDAVSHMDRELIALARSFGKDVGAKLPGSGGAVLVFCPRGFEFESFIRESGKAQIVPLKLRSAGPRV